MRQFRRLALTAVALSGALCSSAFAQPAKGFTLQQVMSAPFNSDLTAAPATGAFAWLSNVEGRRNIWVAEPSSNGGYVSRQVTKYTQDDGQEISGLRWLPDAKAIVYTRGGDMDDAAHISPNPALNPQGEEQDVWEVSLNGGAPRMIGAGHSAAVSPTNDTVAWVLNGEIWFEKLDDANAKPAQLLHTLGDAGSLRWSPDGTKLAFVSDRGSHGFIGVYSFAENKLEYLDPGTDHDQAPIWSPDGNEIAFVRVRYSKDENFDGVHRTAEPWCIIVADVATGHGHPVWTANPGPGSAFWGVVSKYQVFWTANNRLIFPWEADGWAHLYSIPAQGGTPRLLTPGNFEVEYVSMIPDRKTIVYSSNQNDIDRRHVWKLDDTSTAPVELTHGTGIETEPVVASDNKTVAVLRSDAKIPIRPAVITASGAIRDLAPQMIPASFPASQMVVPQMVIFNSTDGMRIHGQLFLPAGSSGCVRHPAVVFVHGGSQRQMLLGWHYMGYYSNSYALNEYLASKGYVVLSINYRSGIGYGLDFREALQYGARGASEFRDIKGGGLYLRSRCDVEPNHIGIWGGSWGGFLTAMALARSSDLFSAGVDMSGVHDWNIDNPQNYAISDRVANPNARWQLAWRSSPLESVNTWHSPVLLIQGDDDRDVPFLQTVVLAAALRKQHVPLQELIFPDGVHDFLLHRHWVAAYSATAKFFDEYLKPASGQKPVAPR